MKIVRTIVTLFLCLFPFNFLNDSKITHSSVWAFTTASEPCTLPGTPINPNPADKAKNVSIDAILDWPDSTNADYYDVYWGDSSGCFFGARIDVSEFGPLTMDYGHTYYWKVIAGNNCGSSEGLLWSFTTEPYTSKSIINGPKTLSVNMPGNALDGDSLTYATILFYWGQDEVFYDFFHFMSYLGTDETFEFSISVGQSTKGSTLTIDGETSPDVWEEIDTVSLDTATTKTIKIPNAQDYVDKNGVINLRARWVDGDSNNDCKIYEIWRTTPKAMPWIPLLLLDD